MTANEKKALQINACKVRMGVIEGTYAAKSGHPGGSLSSADLFTYLYFKEMRIDPKNPRWEERDRLVVSKGHAGPAVYAALALRGFFPLEQLETLNRPGTKLPSHMDAQKTPGVDMTTGSLGQGVSAGVGMALAARMDKRSCQVCVVAGDGECDEGQVWEAALFAAAQGLDNLTTSSWTAAPMRC